MLNNLVKVSIHAPRVGGDGTTWRLHGGPKAKVLFTITADELKAYK
jgi:hypothetical protein